MTGMLASVNSLEEAQLVLKTSVDIIDLKNPKLGALGALPIETVSEIVQAMGQKKRVSATVGDLPMHPEIIFSAVSAMVDTGVDYIKVGFFPGGDWQGCLFKLKPLTQESQIIAVIFADTQPDFSVIKAIKEAGVSGVMLDTMDKSQGSLTQVMSLDNIKAFVSLAKQSQLLCGLAGSLKVDGIPVLLELEADYLGFRGALCEKHDRTAKLSLESIHVLLQSFILPTKT